MLALRMDADRVARLGADAQPVADPILLELELGLARSHGPDGVVPAEVLDDPAVPWGTRPSPRPIERTGTAHCCMRKTTIVQLLAGTCLGRSARDDHGGDLPFGRGSVSLVRPTSAGGATQGF